MSHGEHADGTERQTEGRTDALQDRYITLSARHNQRNNEVKNEAENKTASDDNYYNQRNGDFLNEFQ